MLLALEQNLHIFVNYLPQKLEVDTQKPARVRPFLVATGISISFYLVQEPALAETLIQHPRLGLLVFSKIGRFFRSNRVVDLVRLTTCHLGIFFFVFCCNVPKTANFTWLVWVKHWMVWQNPFISKSSFDF